jgi:hypothetical protein
MLNEKYRTFLLSAAKTDRINHSGKTLFDHLVGTHNLLEWWGNSADVCTAGLFHSIYGTNHFKRRPWPIDDRAAIRDLIGNTAELLVYLFATSDRPAAWFEWHNLPTSRLLREIEAANLLEQIKPGVRSKWLNKLYDTDISDGARRAITAWKKLNAPLCVG